jgi:hypothetical protein
MKVFRREERRMKVSAQVETRDPGKSRTGMMVLGAGPARFFLVRY